MKNTIQSLKEELKTVVKDLRTQKIQYDEDAAQDKYNKAVLQH